MADESQFLVRLRKSQDAVRKFERRESSLISALQLIAAGPPEGTEEWHPDVYAQWVLDELRAGAFDTGIRRAS